MAARKPKIEVASKEGGSLPACPPDLSAEAQAWWGKLCSRFEVKAEHELLLAEALRSWDLLQDAQSYIRTNGHTMIDRFGQPKCNPAVLTARDCRFTILRLLKNLGMETCDARVETDAKSEAAEFFGVGR